MDAVRVFFAVRVREVAEQHDGGALAWVGDDACSGEARFAEGVPMNFSLFNSQPSAVQADVAFAAELPSGMNRAESSRVNAFSLTIFKMPAGATRILSPASLTAMPSFKTIFTNLSKSGTQLNMPALPTGKSLRSTQALSSWISPQISRPRNSRISVGEISSGGMGFQSRVSGSQPLRVMPSGSKKRSRPCCCKSLPVRRCKMIPRSTLAGFP